MLIAEIIEMPFIIEKDYFYEAKYKGKDEWFKIPEKEIIRRTKLRKGYTDTNSRKRADDTIAGLRNRAKYYRKNIAEVVKFFKSVYTFATIDGMGTRAEVQKRIQKAIDFYIKHYEQIHENSRRN